MNLERQGYLEGKHITGNTAGSLCNTQLRKKKRSTLTPVGYFNPSLIMSKVCSIQPAVAEEHLTLP